MAVKTWKGGDLPDTQSVAEILPGGKVKNLEYPRKDFITIRREGRTPTKISLSYVEIFKGLWRLHLSKRLERAEPLAVSVAELVEATRIPEDLIRTGLKSLVASGVVRQVEEFAARSSRRLRFIPMPSGVELLAIAEYMGDGAQIIVGRKVADWVRAEEPPNLFDFAKIVR